MKKMVHNNQQELTRGRNPVTVDKVQSRGMCYFAGLFSLTIDTNVALAKVPRRGVHLSTLKLCLGTIR